jgi:hypothetical protein
MTEQDDSKKPAEQIQSQPKPIEPIRTDEAPVVPSPHPTDEIHNKAKEDKPKWTDKTVALFTLFLFLAAVIQGVIFYGQWQEMKSGGVDTKALANSAKSQADAAKAQADEARVQVEKMTQALGKTDALIKEATAQAVATNRLAAQAQRSADYAKQSVDAAIDAERPWVGVNFYKADDFLEDKTAKITINYTNTGKRPASVNMNYGADTLSKPPLFPTMIGNRSGSVGFMLPGATQTGTVSYEIPKNAFSIWKSKHEIFYILAQIVYTDVGTNKAYITNFCAYYDPANKDLPFPLCPRLNEAR